MTDRGPTLWPVPPSARPNGGLLLRLMDLWPLGLGTNGDGVVAPVGMFRQIAQGATTFSVAAPGGINWGALGVVITHPGAAGVVTSANNYIHIPWHQNPAQWMPPVQFLRYRCWYQTERSVNGGASFSHGFTVQASQLFGAVNNLGFELVTNSALNGGRHTLHVRTAFGGPIVPLVDTGVPATQPTRWEWDYTDGPTKQLIIRANEQAVATVNNPANFPAYVGYVAGESYGRLRLITAAGSAGIVDRFTRVLYEIWEGDGWTD